MLLSLWAGLPTAIITKSDPALKKPSCDAVREPFLMARVKYLLRFGSKKSGSPFCALFVLRRSVSIPITV